MKNNVRLLATELGDQEKHSENNHEFQLGNLAVVQGA